MQQSITFAVLWDTDTTLLDLDVRAYLLRANGMVANDAEFLFYGQNSAAEDAASLDVTRSCFALDLSRMLLDIERVAVSLTSEQGTQCGQRSDKLVVLCLLVSGVREPFEVILGTRGMLETAVILVEFHRRSETWRLRALGRGFNEVLGPLAGYFGVEIVGDADQASTPLALPPVLLNKIALDKRQPVSLDKRGSSFGVTKVNLNLSRQPADRGGWKAFKEVASIDLALGCMFENRSSDKFFIRELGNSFGTSDGTTWVQLMGDDRSRVVIGGEDLRINGDHCTEIKRILLYAFIDEGLPNWASADAVMMLKSPDQPVLTVRLDSPSKACDMCAVP